MTKVYYKNNKIKSNISNNNIRRITAVFLAVILTFVLTAALGIINRYQIYASQVPQEDTPEYKVSFYASDCYNMQDENGKRSGYYNQGIHEYVYIGAKNT